jgi:hypothetical protein
MDSYPEPGTRAFQLRVTIWREELGNSFAAAQLYDQLRTGQRSSIAGRERARIARQVFVEIYESAPLTIKGSCRGERTRRG